MNLTRPEKKEVSSKLPFAMNKLEEWTKVKNVSYNQALDDMSAYQNQQMEGLDVDDIFQGIWNSAKVWKGSPKEDKIQAQCFHESKKDLATQIRKMIGGGR